MIGGMRLTRPAFYTVLYFFILVLLRMKPRLAELLILAGAGLGAFLLGLEERISLWVDQPKDKPILRNALTQGALVVLAFYVGTSSTSLFAFSFVLAVLVRGLIEQYLELRGRGNLGLWFWVLGKPIDDKTPKIYLGVLAFLLFYLSLLLVGR